MLEFKSALVKHTHDDVGLHGSKAALFEETYLGLWLYCARMQVNQQLHFLSLQQLGMLIWSYTKLDLHPPKPWVDLLSRGG